MLTDAECDAIIEATFNGLEGIEVHMLGGDGWSDRALIRAGWQARAGAVQPVAQPVAWLCTRGFGYWCVVDEPPTEPGTRVTPLYAAPDREGRLDTGDADGK